MSAPSSYLIAGLAVISLGLGGFSYVQSLRIDAKDATIAEKDSKIEEWKAYGEKVVAISNGNAAALKAVRRERDTQSAIAVQFQKLAQVRAAKLNIVLKGISDAPASDDGPVAAVLERYLDGMRARASTDDFDPGADRAAVDPGGSPALRDETKAP